MYKYFRKWTVLDKIYIKDKVIVLKFQANAFSTSMLSLLFKLTSRSKRTKNTVIYIVEEDLGKIYTLLHNKTLNEDLSGMRTDLVEQYLEELGRNPLHVPKYVFEENEIHILLSMTILNLSKKWLNMTLHS